MIKDRAELASHLASLLRAVHYELGGLRGGEKVVAEGLAFGDATSDIELMADRKLGHLFVRLLSRQDFGASYVTVEGLGTVAVGHGSVHYFVDPLDGSLNYRSRHGSMGLPYTGCVAGFISKADQLIFSNVVVAGIIDYRSGDAWIASSLGRGRFKALLELRPIWSSADAVLDLRRQIVIGEMYYPSNRERLARMFQGERGWLRNPGSAAYEMALVANGTAVAFICDQQKLHELGAAYALVKGAGGVVVSMDGRDIGSRQYDFNRQLPVVLAGNAPIAREILRRWKQAG